jgi:hypothetical protein
MEYGRLDPTVLYADTENLVYGLNLQTPFAAGLKILRVMVAGFDVARQAFQVILAVEHLETGKVAVTSMMFAAEALEQAISLGAVVDEVIGGLS